MSAEVYRARGNGRRLQKSTARARERQKLPARARANGRNLQKSTVRVRARANGRSLQKSTVRVWDRVNGNSQQKSTVRVCERARGSGRRLQKVTARMRYAECRVREAQDPSCCIPARWLGTYMVPYGTMRYNARPIWYLYGHIWFYVVQIWSYVVPRDLYGT